MTVTRAEIVAEARSWIGTPFMHQQSSKSVGVDCIGLARGIYRECGLRPPEEKLAFARQFQGYSRSPDGVSLKAFCDEMLQPISIDAVQPGDIWLMRFTKHPQHTAFAADYVHGGLSMIHAWNQSDGRGEVVEHRFDDTWRRRVVAAYSLPGVA